MMPPLRSEEEWVRALLQGVLRVPVQEHDDGSRPGMYHLDVQYPDRSPAAVEIVAAADQEAMAFSRTRAERWQVEGLVGGWIVSVAPASRRWKQLARGLPQFLAELEQRGIRELSQAQLLTHPIEAATKLGIRSVLQSPTRFPGSIYVLVEEPLERTGGFPSTTGNEFVEWVGVFLSQRADVRDKLARSRAAERHAFVVLPPFCTAPSKCSTFSHRVNRPAPAKPLACRMRSRTCGRPAPGTLGLAFGGPPRKVGPPLTKPRT